MFFCPKSLFVSFVFLRLYLSLLSMLFFAILGINPKNRKHLLKKREIFIGKRLRKLKGNRMFNI